MNALALGREPMPDVVIAAVGYGLDGGTFIFTDLMSGVWGSHFGACSSTMLQVPREFQLQGRAFIDSAWMTFDQCNHNLGIEEAVMKAFWAAS
eukprot:2709193-Pyramimonas_sp.AAC.1